MMYVLEWLEVDEKRDQDSVLLCRVVALYLKFYWVQISAWCVTWTKSVQFSTNLFVLGKFWVMLTGCWGRCQVSHCHPRCGNWIKGRLTQYKPNTNILCTWMGIYKKHFGACTSLYQATSWYKPKKLGKLQEWKPGRKLHKWYLKTLAKVKEGWLR